MNSNMGQYGHASPFTDQWGLDRVNNPPKNPYLGYNYPKGHLYPQIVPGPSNPPFPHAGNQRIGAVHPLPPSSPPSFFTARGFQSSSQQESNHRLQTNHVNRHSVPMRSTSPTPRSHLPPNRRPASLVRYEYNQYGNCEEEIVYDDADQPSNLDRSPYIRRHGSSATRPSLGRPNLRDRSLDRPSQRSDGMPKLQPPNYEMRSFMPPMRRNEAAGDDVEMDNLRARDQRPSLERSLRRGEDSPNLHVFPHSSERASRHQFPSYDMKLFATPRRVEREDGVDIFEYSPRESRRSFERPPAHMDGPPSNYSHHHSEEKRRFQPPNYDMRMFATPNRGEPKDLMDVDPYGANYPPRSVRDERPKFQFPTYDVKGLVTPRRGGQDNGMIHSDMFIPGGPYRPLPPIRNPLGERRSAMTANRQSPPPLPPALPPLRERLTAGSRSDKKRSVPLFFLKKPVFGKRVRVFTTKDKIEMAKQGSRRLRATRKYCDVCERRFTSSCKLAKHLRSGPHLKNLNLFKEAIAKIKEDEGDESLMSKDVYNGKSPKIHCGLCKETFINKTRYMEHLKFRRHKVNARIHQVFKVVKNKAPDQLIKLPAEDPLEAFCLYMNSDAHTTLFGEKAEETTTTTTTATSNNDNHNHNNNNDNDKTVSSTVPDFTKQTIFMRKYLDLRHLLYEEPGPAGEEYIDELDQAPIKEKKPYYCSLCNANLCGVDTLENHLHSVSHQEQYKSRVDPQWTIQKAVASSLSFEDAIFDMWKACKDKHKRDMRIVERNNITLQCVCSYEIKTFTEFKQHYPKIFPQNVLFEDSEMFAAAEYARKIRSYRNIFRECINILKLFTLPDEVIVAKRAYAINAAKARACNNNQVKMSSSPAPSPPPPPPQPLPAAEPTTAAITTTTPTEPSQLDNQSTVQSFISIKEEEENKAKQELGINSTLDNHDTVDVPLPAIVDNNATATTTQSA